MKKCFGYIRVSTQKQGEGVSLDAQRAAIEQFAARNDLIVCRWFEEKATAAKKGRPVFGTLVKALKRGEADGLIFHKIDRSARNFGDWNEVGELAEYGIDVYFATETLDFRSRGGRLAADIQAVIAADYIRNLREETIKGLNGRLSQGLYPFRAPIGYQDNGGGKPKTPDPQTASLIQLAFELYASGQHSLRSLRRELHHRGLRNAKGRPLSKCGLETILNNPFYCGLIRIKRTGALFEGVHEPIISAALFERVRDVKEGKAGKKVTRHNHAYRGLFRCGECQSAMTPERQKGHVYYRCQRRECPTKCIREEALEQAIEQTLSVARLTDEHIASLSEGIESWCEANRDDGAEKALRLQLGQTDARLDALTDALVDRLIDADAFGDRKQRLLLERARLREKLDAAQRKAADPARVFKFLELVKSLAATYLFAKPAEKRELVEMATSNRHVIGTSAYLQPANWLARTEHALSGLLGAPYRPTSRNPQHLPARHVEELIEVAKCGAVAEVYAKLEEPSDPSVCESRPIAA